MNKRLGMLFVGLMVATACSTHVNILPTHRQDIVSQAQALAMSAANLEGAVRGRVGGSPRADAAAQTVVAFHSAAETFAREADRWASDEVVDKRYETLITAWVQMKRAYPDLQPDAMIANSFTHVADEYERLARLTGYAGKRYQESVEGK